MAKQSSSIKVKKRLATYVQRLKNKHGGERHFRHFGIHKGARSIITPDDAKKILQSDKDSWKAKVSLHVQDHFFPEHLW